MDITIKEIPNGAEEAVKQMAMVAIERFLVKPLQPPQEAVSKFQKDMDKILVANDMAKKYEQPKSEPILG
jgi:tripartite-type tricarboxylate transporter receptor subunit TctC